MTAFDYDSQTWLTGEPARQTLLKQLRMELAILQGPRAADFLGFRAGHGLERELPAAIARCKESIERLTWYEVASTAP